MRTHFGGPTASFTALEKLLAGMLSELQQITQHNRSNNSSCSSSSTPASSLLVASAAASIPSSLFRAAAVTAMGGPTGAASPLLPLGHWGTRTC